MLSVHGLTRPEGGESPASATAGLPVTLCMHPKPKPSQCFSLAHSTESGAAGAKGEGTLGKEALTKSRSVSETKVEEQGIEAIENHAAYCRHGSGGHSKEFCNWTDLGPSG